MRVTILGSAAGGGYPQWNCRCAVCALFWDGDPRVRRRTQSSVAVSADGARWTILNCSPDVREQIAQVKALQPNGRPRGSPIHSVVVTNGDVDHIAGLISLREQSPFALHGTDAVLGVINGNSLFDVLNPQSVSRTAFDIGKMVALGNGLFFEAFLAPGKVPLYLEEGTLETDQRSTFTVGLKVWSDPARKLVYLPGCGRVDDELRREIEGAAALLFDGTVWTDDEMAQAGTGAKTGRRMGHLPVSGADGSMEALQNVTSGRRVFVHINNTNPLLIDGSPERLRAEAMGWETGYDGMEFSL
jgi:pyrroloquinoline quinone biosynthesis protein B